MNQLPTISFSCSTVVQLCHSSTPQTMPSHNGTCLTRYSMPEKHGPDFVGGAGTASCPVWRRFYHTYILQCSPAGGEDADAQQSPARSQLQHLWQAGPGICTALRISTLPTKYCPLPSGLLLCHSWSILSNLAQELFRITSSEERNLSNRFIWISKNNWMTRK